jgi:hypothetical protein
MLSYTKQSYHFPVSRFKVQIKDSILKQPVKRYIPTDIIGVQFLIDFAKCDAKNPRTIEYLKVIMPSEKNIVAANAVMVWIVTHKELDLKLYSPLKNVVEYIDNNQAPYGVQKKEILRHG